MENPKENSSVGGVQTSIPTDVSLRLKQRRKGYLILASIIFMLGLIALLSPRSDWNDPRMVINAWDIEDVQGLLIPTADSIPTGFVKDDNSYGFGSNDGCHHASYNKKSEERYYCYRFIDKSIATDDNYSLYRKKIIEFRELKYNVGGSSYSLDPFKLETVIQYRNLAHSINLTNSLTNYTVQHFVYNNSQGSVLKYTYNLKEQKMYVWQLFWDDDGKFLIITQRAENDIYTPQQLLDTLGTMRRLTEKGLRESGEGNTAPYFIDEPVFFGNSSQPETSPAAGAAAPIDVPVNGAPK